MFTCLRYSRALLERGGINRVLTINYADQGFGDVTIQDSLSTLREIIESLGSRGSMVARLKLKGIDGRAHQKWSLRLNKLGRQSLLGERKNTTWFMTTCTNYNFTARAFDERQTSVSTSVETNRFHDNVLYSDTTLVVAEVAGSFSLAPVGNDVLLQKKSKMGDLNIGFRMAPART